MNITKDEAGDIFAAECLGNIARASNSHVKAPAQDVEFIKLLAKHSKPLGEESISKELLEAWNRGFRLKNDQLAEEYLSAQKDE